MAANKAEIINAVMSVAKAAEKRNGSQKKAASQQMIISKSIKLLSESDEIEMLDRDCIQISATVVYCIYSELCAYDYYKSLPEVLWPGVIFKAYKRITEKLSEQELLVLFCSPQKVIDILKDVFINAKEEVMPNKVKEELKNIEEKYKTYYKKTPSSEIEAIIEKTYNRFMLNHDPFGEHSVEGDYKKYFNNELSDFYNDKGKRPPDIPLDAEYSPEESGIKNEEMIPDPNSLSPEESLIEKTKALIICDVMRDLLNASDRMSISKISLGYYRCFYTDNVSAMIEEDILAYKHLCRNIKLYNSSNGIDISFLNFFVEYKCEIITDAYHKPRKLLSVFKPQKESSERCRQPLELAVIGKYLGKSDSSVSTFRTKYNKMLKTKLIEDTLDSERQI